MDVVRGLLTDIDYDDWLDAQCDSPKKLERAKANVEELLGSVERLSVDEDQKEQPLADVVRSLCLHDMLSRQDEDGEDDRVQMSTLHAAKGLEYPHVFMVGMEEELLPHRNSLADDGLEEERRLAYVGMTRARFTLTFTRTRSRQQFGETSSCEASRFLDDLPREDVVTLGELGDPAAAEQRRETGKAALKGLMDMLAED